MQFKNPEILYFLALLIIPILIHLFQLQKFVKVPFSNVAFLQKIQQQTRKSSRIKKWLILATRILLFSAIIFAFTQPYFSNKNIDKKEDVFIYLDNSLSTDTRGKKGHLLKIAAQEIIENTDVNSNYSLLTNTHFHKDISNNELKEILLKTEKTSKTLDFSTILLKLSNKKTAKTNTSHKNILISDFQNTYINEFTNVTANFSCIKLKANQKNNISIDSVYITDKNTTNFTIHILVQNQGPAQKKVPIAVFNDQKLISKQTFSIAKDEKKTIPFTVQNTTSFLGKISLTFSDTFNFDNHYFFTLNKVKKTKVLAIGKNNNYLSKIYTKDEFNFTSTNINFLNYNSILDQQLIILNELENIPEILSNSILEFSKNGGSIAIIPNKKTSIASYNFLFKKLGIGSIKPKVTDSLKITNIYYNHPLFKNVFSKKVKNFQYPSVLSFYPIISKNKSNIVSFENNTSFICQLNHKNIYFIASPLNKENSNFLNSPLVVPVFYNIGNMSFYPPQLAYRVAHKNTIEIESQLGKDEILSIKNEKKSFIPLQKILQNKVVITTNEQPLDAGFYQISKNQKTLQTIAFNYPKEESKLQFLDLNKLTKMYKNSSVYPSVATAFKEIKKNNEVHWLWKWFLALAIVSLCLEILILKFYKS